jgi:hypothetical protein
MGKLLNLKMFMRSLHFIFKDLDVLDLKCGCTKQWAQGLGRQVQLMCKGSRAYVMPLPAENLTGLAANITRVFFISPCPICGLLISCNNIVLTSCGCTYHLFCICVYLASKATKCAILRCEQTFTQEWFTSWGFNQMNVLLNSSKIEWANKSLTSTMVSFVETYLLCQIVSFF